MPFKTPRFWYPPKNTHSLIPTLLSPLSALYYAGHKMNMAHTKTQSVPIPVICMGNATAGGSGKTPTSIALCQLLRDHNIVQNPFFLTRGYGGKSDAPRIIHKNDTVSCAGDEPLILASHSKTIISMNRYDGALFAHKSGADCIIMDDGFQNPSLKKDVSFLVVDGHTGFGNEKIIPSGPLREPIADAIARCDGIVMIGDDIHNIGQRIPPDIALFTASIAPSTHDFLDKDRHYIGFAGLGHPQKFHKTLNENGFKVIDFHAFADHHPYTENDIERLLDKTREKNALLITTEKDIVRIPEQYREKIAVLNIELHFHDPDNLLNFLRKRLSSVTD